MSYQVLARKWRPGSFDAVCGQRHVLAPLIQALDQQRLHHAYLFSGTRGVGKTTLGRLLAKGLNCEQGISSQPCGECKSCRDIQAGCCVDLLEVDAASRTKVEDTRELLDNVQYSPAQYRFKIYLIDEAHMLSRHSFNALLKTLEEPPAHVKFILATTEPNKLPATVISRCLQFHLKALSVDEIKQQLTAILHAENAQSEPEALTLLADAAQGSMRDALSLLDQALSYNTQYLTYQTVAQMLGTVNQNDLYQLVAHIAVQDVHAAMAAVQKIVSYGPDFDILHAQLERLLHQIALVQVTQEVIEPTQSEHAPLPALAQKMTPEETQLFYQIALNGRRDLPYSPDFRSGFEMTVLRMLAFKPVPSQETAKKKYLIQPLADTDVKQSVETDAMLEPHQAVEQPVVEATPKPCSDQKQEDLSAVALTPSGSSASDASDAGDFIERIIQKRTELLAANQSEGDDQFVRAKAIKTQPERTDEASTTRFTRAKQQAPVELNWETWIEKAQLSGLLKQIALDAVLEYQQGHASIIFSKKHHRSFTTAYQGQLCAQLKRVYPAVDIEIQWSAQVDAAQTPRVVREQRRQAQLQALKDDIVHDEKLNALLKPFDGCIQLHTLQQRSVDD